MYMYILFVYMFYWHLKVLIRNVFIIASKVHCRIEMHSSELQQFVRHLW